MKKIKLFIVFAMILLVFSSPAFAEKIAVLSQLMKPDTLVLDDQHLYIKERSTVFIYSRKDFSLLKKFGREGEGPQEFKNLQEIIPHTEKLQLNSMNKVSFYKKDGSFLKEVKIINGYQFFPLKNGYVGRATASDHGVNYITVNIFDPDFKNVREIARMISLGQTSEKIELLRRKLIHHAGNDRVFVASKEGFVIDIFDGKGDFLYSISHDYPKFPLNAEDEKFIRQTFKRRNLEFYESIKNRLDFPKYFPEIRDIMVEEGKIYVLTYRRQGENSEFLFFDRDGKFQKAVFLPLGFSDFFTSYPFAIYKGKMFQLKENPEEEWELLVIHLIP